MSHILVQVLTRHPLDVIATIRQTATNRRLKGADREAADDAIAYLHKNSLRIHYAEFLAEGLPIATGVIEGACRHLVQDRMGITGARWGLVVAEAVLKCAPSAHFLEARSRFTASVTTLASASPSSAARARRRRLGLEGDPPRVC